MPLLRCPISDYYARQEKNGLLVGFYEQDCRTWGMDGINPNFSNDLCPDDLDRVMDALEGAIKQLRTEIYDGITGKGRLRGARAMGKIVRMPNYLFASDFA